MQMFKNRSEAGRMLADKLSQYKGSNSVVYAIPRGGIPVGYEVAKALNIPLEILLSKKIGHPIDPEFAVGAVCLDAFYVDQGFSLPHGYVEEKVEQLRSDLLEKYKLYKGERPAISPAGKTAIIIDDGIATGNTVFAAIRLIRNQQAEKIVLAIPVAPAHNGKLRRAADEYVCLMSPFNFGSVGTYYLDFSEVSDKEVIELLKKSMIKLERRI